MDSKTFYLKYRPQRLTELDSGDVSQSLAKIVKSHKIPHALLFTGPKGIGKTSAARILAKAINCLKPSVEGEPCNKCEICTEITNGSALDLIEIDAASNRGIDNIRDLREKIKLSPVKCHYKVYIIDEVHMLTVEAFNALLKTLEEPPNHAVFILCTTESEKLPQTIVSRCLRFNFLKAKPEEIIKCLERAVAGEKLQTEKGVLEEISRFVDGSFRDAHKVLDQLALEGKKITLKATQKILGQLEELSPGKLFSLLVKSEVKPALKEIDRVMKTGGDLNIYLQQLLDWLRRALLAKVGLEDIDEPAELSEFNESQIKCLISLFSQAAAELRFAPIPQLPLELAVVEYCLKTPQTSPSKSQAPIEDADRGNGGEVKLQKLETKWGEILTKIKPLNHSVEALLKASRPLKIDGEILTLEVFYKFHKERLETEKCRAIVEETMTQTLGVPIKLKCVLGEKKPMVAKQAESSDIMTVASEIFNGQLVD